MKREGDTWVVFFYAPWCGHCTAAAPSFQQAALQAPVHFARLDAAAYSDVAQAEGVTGYPTIRLYDKGEVVANFGGERTVVDFLDFARQAVKKLRG
ncbi:thioredoxin-like protein [Baffinella frigidus]|nr:thioredoxin-like protein [Cryptophyta sp. CCMP2293]